MKDFDEFSPTLQFCLSAAVTAAMIALVAFVISLFFWNGPWVPNCYSKGTSAGSIVQKRPLNPGFDREKYLREHPAPKVGPWGRIIINIDMDRILRCCRKAKDNDSNDQDHHVKQNRVGNSEPHGDLDMYYKSTETERKLITNPVHIRNGSYESSYPDLKPTYEDAGAQKHENSPSIFNDNQVNIFD